MRLYHLPPSRSTRVLWLLEEIGQPYELTVMKGEDRQTDEHRRRHPLGRVPVLEDDEGFLFESAALCLHLADLHPDAQLNWPLATHERALVYQWTVFAMTELEPAIIEARRHREDDPARAQAGVERFQAAAAAVEQALDGHEYLVGDRFSVADIVCGAVLIIANSAQLTDELPNIEAYIERLEARPARQRATAIGT
jgi:glutathione S-transferase